MLERMYLRLEIMGYSRAISQMVGVRGVTASHMTGLYRDRQMAIDKLAVLVQDARDQRAERNMSNA